MNSKTYSCGLVAALLATGCQINDGVLCSYLNDECGGSGGEEEDIPPPASPCEQIGSALGLDLQAPSNSGGQNNHHWYESTAWVWSMHWSSVFPSGWVWDSVPPNNFERARLYGEQGELAVYEPHRSAVEAGSLTSIYVWTQGEAVDSAFLGATAAGILPQHDGSQLVYAPSQPIDAWWLFEGSVLDSPVLRGQTTLPHAADQAGPAWTNTQEASHMSRGWEHARGWCVVVEPPATAADDTAGSGDGGGTGDPDGITPGEDPCRLVAEHFNVGAITTASPWAGPLADTTATYLTVPPPSPIVSWNGSGWDLPPEGHAFIGPFGDMRVHPTAAISDGRAGWIVVPADQADGWEMHWHVWQLNGDNPSDYPRDRFEVVGPVEGTDLVVMAVRFERPENSAFRHVDQFRIVNTVPDDSRRLAGVVVGYEGLEPLDWVTASDLPGAATERLWADGRSWVPMGGVCLLGQASPAEGGSSSGGEAVDESGG
jgi:hypothetical protein